MKRLFGTDGVRGEAGAFPLDAPTVARIGAALIRSLGIRDRPARILIGRDTRESGPEIEAALVRGIQAEGGLADRGGVLTTPAVACVTRSLGYDAGIVVSASHNPYHDNGIKVFSSAGFKLPDAIEMEIERQVLDAEPAARPGAEHAAMRGEHLEPEALQRCYLESLGSALGPGPPSRGGRWSSTAPTGRRAPWRRACSARSAPRS
jgi:phosphoglucosamine mutase